MNKIFFLLCTFLFAFNINAKIFEYEIDMSPRQVYPKRLFMPSYPRSGSNWLAYCIETLTNVKVAWSSNVPNNVDSKEGIPVSTITSAQASKISVVSKLHNFTQNLVDTLQDVDNNGLILIVRNYKESGLRTVNFDREHCDSFLRLLKLYDACKAPKILIYYEDLISNPKLQLKRLVDFMVSFGGAKEGLDDFIEKLDWHKNRSLRLYTPGSVSGGKLNYHLSKISYHEKKELDNWFKNRDSYLYKKYLQRYATENEML